MDACRASFLGDPHDGVLDVTRCGHHEVGQLVDDRDDVGIGPVLSLAAQRRRDFTGSHLVVEVVDVAHPGRLHVLVALLHLLDQPRQRCRRLLRLSDDRGDQMRNALIGRQFHHLRVDQDHPDLFRGGPGQQRHQHGVDEAGLTGSGGAGDQQMRHLGQVGRDEIPFDVLTQPDHQRMMVATGRRRSEYVGESHHFAVGVGDLDADGGLAGDRRQHADALGGHRVGDVALQRGDLFHLDARPQLDLVAGDGGPAGATGDGRVDLELGEHVTNRAGHLDVGGTAFLRRIAGDQQAQGRQRVGTLDDPVQMFFFPRGSTVLRGGGFRNGGNVVIERGLERAGRRPRLRLIVGIERSAVVVTVGKVFTRGILACFSVAVLVVASVVASVVVIPVSVVALERPGPEHGAHHIRHLADRGPSQQQQPEQRADGQKRRGNPRRQPVRQRPTDGEADESCRATPRFRVFGRTGPQVAQAEDRKRDQARAQDQPGPRVGVGLSPHQRYRGRGYDHRQHEDSRADQCPQHLIDPRTNRPGGVEPRTRGHDDGKAQQNQRNSVASMPWLDVAGPPDRPRRTPGALCRH